MQAKISHVHVTPTTNDLNGGWRSYIHVPATEGRKQNIYRYNNYTAMHASSASNNYWRMLPMNYLATIIGKRFVQLFQRSKISQHHGKVDATREQAKRRLKRRPKKHVCHHCFRLQYYFELAPPPKNCLFL